MGRKPIAPKLAEKLQKHESANTHVEPESNNPSSEKEEVQLESTNPIQEPQQTNSSKAYSRKKMKKSYAEVRRSGRLQNAVMTTENRDIERIIEEITVSESDKEDEPVEEELPQPDLKEKSDLHEKVDYVIQLLQAQQRKTMDALNSRETEKTFFNGSSSTGDVTYKSLYIDSQKKIEALTEENHQLNRKLEYALGKIEVYEKGNHMATQVLEKLKDMLHAFWFSNSARAPEATVEKYVECKTSTKRKKPDKETEKN